MASASLAIVALTSDVGVLQADVAGYPLHHYLLEHLGMQPDLDVEIAPASGSSLPPWCDGFRMFDGNLSSARAAVVVIDAHAWLPPAFVEQLLARARTAPHFLRAVATPSHDDASAGARTLAVAFPARMLSGSIVSALKSTGRALTWDWAADAIDIDMSSLQIATPARLVANTVELAAVEQDILRARATEALRAGVRVRDAQSLQIRGELKCGTGVEIDCNVIIEGVVTLADGVRVGANSIVRQASVGKQTRIEPFSLIEGSTVGAHGVIGPYGRIRPGSTLGDRVQIGNFVEIKNARLGEGCRINHHSFIGDADLADNVTIGAGTITCNHDGTGTVHTVIERGAYVGSGCQLVAPVRIGERATIGAGSTITRDVPPATLTLARSPQTTIENWRGPKSRRQPRT